MNRLIPLIYCFVLFFFLCLTSCQKEDDYVDDGSGSSKDIIGDYDLVNIYSRGLSRIDAIDQGISLVGLNWFDYTTFNNVGTIKITENKITSNQVAYEVSDTVFYSFNFDGDIDEGFDLFEIPVPATNGSSDYVKVGNDSITYSNAVIVGADPTTGNPSYDNSGQKYRWSGDTLILIANTNYENVSVVQGIRYSERGNLYMETRLKKRP